MNDKGYALKLLLTDSYQELQKRYENNGKSHEPFTLDTVEIKLNSSFGFLKKGGLYVLSGATPQDNRNCLTQMTIANVADNKFTRKVLVFLRKTNIQEWGMQLLSYASGVSMRKMRVGNFDSTDWRSFAEATGYLADVDVHLYEDADELNVCVDYCRARHQAGDSFDVVVIDGLTPQEANDLDDEG
ncbi:MAG: DnaB-like helicase C-terminal domain-containing protein [Ghiorsea sp.]|nr:DnaB-like helicase C-terminal domain-containing protein [Ghiorsea sp.]